MSVRDELQDLRDILGENAYIEAIWAIRARNSQPVPKPYTRNWKWSREKVVSLAAYRSKAGEG